MTSPSGPSRVRLVVHLGAAAAGALMTWLVMLKWYPFFLAGTVPRLGPSPEEIAKNLRTAYLNAAAVTTLAAALIAAAMALCEAISRRSILFAVVAVLTAAVLGGAGGDAGGCCGQMLDQHVMVHKLQELPLLEGLGESSSTIVVQGACWGLAGLGIGLGLAVTSFRDLRTVIRAAVGGTLGGLIAGLIFPLLTALLGLIVPLPDFGGIVPDTATHRLLWLEIAAISIAMGIGGGVRPPISEAASNEPH